MSKIKEDVFEDLKKFLKKEYNEINKKLELNKWDFKKLAATSI